MGAAPADDTKILEWPSPPPLRRTWQRGPGTPQLGAGFQPHWGGGDPVSHRPAKLRA